MSESPGGLEKTQTTGPHAQSLWFRRSGQGLRTCIYTTVTGDAHAAAPGPHRQNGVKVLHPLLG